jgi:hypothetical protein
MMMAAGPEDPHYPVAQTERPANHLGAIARAISHN